MEDKQLGMEIVEQILTEEKENIESKMSKFIL